MESKKLEWRKQKFLIRAEDMTGRFGSFYEIELPLEHILQIINLLYRQKRAVKIGQNFLSLLITSNPSANQILSDMGITDIKHVRDGDEDEKNK